MDDEPPSPRNALIALVLVAALVGGGWWVSRVLHNASRTEDCLLHGGRNCAPLDPSLRR
jgi:hypothetical protein